MDGILKIPRQPTHVIVDIREHLVGKEELVRLMEALMGI